MLSIFSCDCWPFVCLLWRNIYVFGPYFDWVFWVFDNELYELSIYFGIKSLLVASSANIFPQFLSCFFVLFMVSFAACAKTYKFYWGSTVGFCFFLLLFLLPWQTNLGKYCCDLCHRIFCLKVLILIRLFFISKI